MGEIFIAKKNPPARWLHLSNPIFAFQKGYAGESIKSSVVFVLINISLADAVEAGAFLRVLMMFPTPDNYLCSRQLH